MLSRSGKSGQPCLVPQHSQYHLTSVRMAMIKKKKNVGEDLENLEPLYTVGRKTKQGSA